MHTIEPLPNIVGLTKKDIIGYLKKQGHEDYIHNFDVKSNSKCPDRSWLCTLASNVDKVAFKKYVEDAKLRHK